MAAAAVVAVAAAALLLQLLHSVLLSMLDLAACCSVDAPTLVVAKSIVATKLNCLSGCTSLGPDNHNHNFDHDNATIATNPHASKRHRQSSSISLPTSDSTFVIW